MAKIARYLTLLIFLGFQTELGPLRRSEPMAEGWLQALRPWNWVFPQDHGSHPEFRTEWWYFTGNLKTLQGRHFGYQLTFFRHGIRKDLPPKANSWSLTDLYMAHFALTDTMNKKFRSYQRASRAGPGLAYCKTGSMDVRLLDWWAVMEDGIIRLHAAQEEIALDLELSPAKGPIFHGEKGLSRKGSAPGQASHYYSFSRMETRGTLKVGPDSPSQEVWGQSWFDHEFGSNQLAEDQLGWDWFSLQLSDGRELMIYMLRLRDGSVETNSSGTLVEKDGSSRHLSLEEVRISVRKRWKSPQSGALYPSGWEIQVPGSGVTLRIQPVMEEQELNASDSTGITYWEGAVAGEGMSAGKPVDCVGYAELTGYAGKLGGMF